MARKGNADSQAARQLLTAFLRLPWQAQVAIVVLVLVVGGITLLVSYNAQPPHTAEQQPDPAPGAPDAGDLEHVPPPPAGFPPGSRTVVFCLWNLENLFDDRPDRRAHSADRQFDAWLATDAAARELKYRRLTEALLRLNGGVGPDIIVGIEVESRRAAELLRDSLNASLPAGAPRYEHVAMQELSAGRYIAPCVISRYPLAGARLHGRLQRTLSVRVTANGHDLHLVASHWTSQLSDDGTRETGGRAGYAATIAELYHDAIVANPRVDFLVCGDFNDTPESDVVRNKLGMVGDWRLVTPDARPPRLFGLLSGKSPDQFGTYFYNNKPLIYDQVGVSPGMLDNIGWGYVPESVRVPTDGLIRQGTKGRRPWRFGSPTDDAVGRGYSDHFPVVATLQVAP
jgi:endonuclease/exonuclease/phosphatase family metal-dependent hydrolase